MYVYVASRNDGPTTFRPALYCCTTCMHAWCYIPKCVGWKWGRWRLCADRISKWSRWLYILLCSKYMLLIEYIYLIKFVLSPMSFMCCLSLFVTLFPVLHAHIIVNYNLVFKVHISIYLKPVLYQLGQLRFSFRFIQILQQPFWWYCEH
jgi:hypothetical protein